LAYLLLVNQSRLSTQLHMWALLASASCYKSCRVFPLWEKSDPDRRV
jgi:hypothetical protein